MILTTTDENEYTEPHDLFVYNLSMGLIGEWQKVATYSATPQSRQGT